MSIVMNQASVGTAASLVGYIPPAGYLMASGPSTVYLGTGSAVTASSGFQMTTAAPVVWQNTLAGPQVPVYAVASSAAQALSYSFGNGAAGQVIAGGSAALQLNHSAANIQPVGVAGTAGSTGLAADSGHVHSGLSLVAATGTAGTALINGTPVMLSWVPPADGAMHRVVLFGEVRVFSGETGGAIAVSFTDPGGNAASNVVIAGAQATGIHGLTANAFTVGGGGSVSVAQSSALTGGTATMWMEIWGS